MQNVNFDLGEMMIAKVVFCSNKFLFKSCDFDLYKMKESLKDKNRSPQFRSYSLWFV